MAPPLPNLCSPEEEATPLVSVGARHEQCRPPRAAPLVSPSHFRSSTSRRLELGLFHAQPVGHLQARRRDDVQADVSRARKHHGMEARRLRAATCRMERVTVRIGGGERNRRKGSQVLTACFTGGRKGGTCTHRVFYGR
jgi:hypothetical protein